MCTIACRMIVRSRFELIRRDEKSIDNSLIPNHSTFDMVTSFPIDERLLLGEYHMLIIPGGKCQLHSIVSLHIGAAADHTAV